MKTLYTAIFIVFTIFITCAKSKNNCEFIDTVDSFDLSKLPGEWFTIMRWENGVENNTTCIKTVIPDDLTKTRSLTYSGGKVVAVKGAFNVKKSCQSKIFIDWPKSAGFPPNEFVIYNDDEYSLVIVLGCFENTEYLWVYSREQYPCKKVLKKIDKVIEEHNLKRHKIYRLCYTE